MEQVVSLGGRVLQFESVVPPAIELLLEHEIAGVGVRVDLRCHSVTESGEWRMRCRTMRHGGKLTQQP